MDLSTLPDLAQHFTIAVQFGPDFVQHGVDQARNFFEAFGQNSPLTFNEKLFHGGKFVTLAALFAVTVAEGNAEAIIGTGFAEADTIYDICKAGAHCHGKGSAPEI